MPVLVPFLAGATAAGALYFTLHSIVLDRTAIISHDLQQLSKDLETLAPSTVIDRRRAIGERLPLKEHVKARWNETVENAVAGVYYTDWKKVASNAWTNTKETGRKLQERLGDGGRQ